MAMRGVLIACAWVAFAFVPLVPPSRSRAVLQVDLATAPARPPAPTAALLQPGTDASRRALPAGARTTDVLVALALGVGAASAGVLSKRRAPSERYRLDRFFLRRAHSARRAPAPQLKENEPASKNAFANVIPFLQRDVPVDQQPSVELRELQRQPFYDWADDDERYKSKLLSLYQFLSIFASLPIAYTTYHRLPFELPQLLLSANIGTCAAMTPFVARLRIGYGYVSKRLRERTIYYEAEQRGLFAQKEEDTLLRDRLTEKSQVAPALKRIDASIAALVAALAISTGSGEALTIIEGEAGPATIKTFLGDDATRLNNRLRSDPEFAAREQQRALSKGNADGTGVKPVYCDSRYYKIVAGGGNC